MFYDLTESKLKADGTPADKSLIDIEWKCPACKKTHKVKWPKSICRAVAYAGGASLFCDKKFSHPLVDVPIKQIKMA